VQRRPRWPSGRGPLVDEAAKALPKGPPDWEEGDDDADTTLRRLITDFFTDPALQILLMNLGGTS
jgi:hypothetical protein